jgi:hypothetical protein
LPKSGINSPTSSLYLPFTTISQKGLCLGEKIGAEPIFLEVVKTKLYLKLFGSIEAVIPRKSKD